MTSKPLLPHRTPQSACAASASETPAPPVGRSAPVKVREAMDARDALATALTRAGVQLPAMDVRTPWADAVDETGTVTDASNGGHGTGRAGEPRYALIHLGVCSAPVAQALAAVIMKGVAG